MKGNYGSGGCGRGNGESQGTLTNEFVQYTADQGMVLEQLFGECAKPSHSQRLVMISENPILSNLDSEQIKVWFQNRRCLEKQKKDALEFQSVNDKMAATKKLLLVENDFLQKELLQLVRENEYIRKLLQNVSATTIDTNYESAVNSYQYLSKPADNSKGFSLLAEECMREFSPVVTRSALDWVLIPRMKVFNVIIKLSSINPLACKFLCFLGFIKHVINFISQVYIFVAFMVELHAL